MREPGEHCRPADRVPAYGYFKMVNGDIWCLAAITQVAHFERLGFTVAPAARYPHPGV